MKPLSRSALARVVAHQLPKNSFVNLGIGAPTEIANYLPEDRNIMIHSENGILNVGTKPAPGKEDHDLINAGKSPITIKPGGAYFDSSLAFAMMRGGHLDVAVLGAFQVSEKGDLANWTANTNDGNPPAVGGAIDLAVGARQIWVMMDHVTKTGEPKLVKACTLPLTATKVVTRIFSNYGIIAVEDNGLTVEALVNGITFDILQELTEASLKPAMSIMTISSDGTVI
ncbi:MAG: 3-oxoacid CoA-transferase subunit B [Burkholderiaceae bacterium]|jgi:3-oxoadipate CoA-transferase beta subunit